MIMFRFPCVLFFICVTFLYPASAFCLHEEKVQCESGNISSSSNPSETPSNRNKTSFESDKTAHIKCNTVGSKCDINLYYSHFYRGNIHSSTEFHPDEYISVCFELPHTFLHQKKYNIKCKLLLISDKSSLPNDEMQSSGHQYTGMALNDTLPFTNIYDYHIPKDIEPGDYKFQLEVHDLQTDITVTKTDNIKIVDTSTLRIAGFMTFHDFPQSQNWRPGSFCYIAGEYAGIEFNICGLATNDKNVTKVSMLYELIDANNNSFVLEKNIVESTSLNGMLHYNGCFPLSQPGEYIYKITIEDLYSKKTCCYKTKILCLPHAKKDSVK